MKIRITGRNETHFKNNLNNALNIASLIARGGSMPDPGDLKQNETRGVWFRKSDDFNGYVLFPSVNSHFAYVRGQDLFGVEVEFTYRYDSEYLFRDGVLHAIKAALQENAEIISE